MRRLLKFALPAALSALAACSPASDSSADVESFLEVPEGKEDNYFSTVSQEYDLTGTDVVRVEGSYTGDAAAKRARQLSLARVKAVTWFAGQALDTAKAGYASLRFASTGVQPVESEAYGSWSFPFHLEINASKTLLSSDWVRVDGGGDRYFNLDLPALSNEELLSGSYTTTYAKFDPTLLPEGSRDTLRIDVAVSKVSVDAYPEYRSMLADKTFDIDIFVGWDSTGSHRPVVDSLFEGLKGYAASSNLKTVSDLRRDTSFLRLLGTPAGIVDTNIRLIHPGLAGVDGGDLADMWREAVAKHDVVIFVGWGGTESFSGVRLHEDADGTVPASEFSKLKLPSKQQLFVFNGTDTYGTFADALFANPAKADQSNLDVLTAANWVSDHRSADATMALVQGLTARNERGHLPASYGTILASMSSGRSAYAVYGVHGIDNNPHQSPWADITEVGKQCASSRSCTGADTLCVRTAGASCSVCAPSCFDDTSCTGGTRCRPIYDSNNSTLVGKQCVTIAPVCR
jgi:hypothetical protein